MRIAESVLGLIREQRNEALESWVRWKDACPVREGAEGKGPEMAPRRRPTSQPVRFEGARWGNLLAGRRARRPTSTPYRPRSAHATRWEARLRPTRAEATTAVAESRRAGRREASS